MEQQRNENKQFFSQIGLIYLAGGVLMQILARVIGTVVRIWKPEWIGNSNLNVVLSALVVDFIAIPLIMLMLGRIPAKAPAKVKIRWYQWLGAYAVCEALGIGSNIIGGMVSGIFGAFKGSAVRNQVLETVTSVDVRYGLIFLVIIAPIFEELLFRKFLIDRTRRYGEGIAVILSGLMFGLYHGNLNQFGYAFALGCVMAYVYAKTGNVIHTILLHMSINSIGGFLAPLCLEAMDYEEYLRQTMIFLNTGDQSGLIEYLVNHSNGVLFMLLLVCYVFILAVVGLVVLIVLLAQHKIHFENGEIIIPKGERMHTVIFNPGMALYCIFGVLLIGLQLLA